MQPGILNRFPHSHATTPMPTCATHYFANTIGGLVERCNHKRLIAQTQPGKGVPDTLPCQDIPLYQQRRRMNHNLLRKVRLDARDERPGTEL
jgi:hypothetical protein